MKSAGMNIAFILVFGMFGLTQFTENVRTVQVLDCSQAVRWWEPLCTVF